MPKKLEWNFYRNKYRKSFTTFLDTFKALVKALIWFFWNTVWGLAPLVVMVFFSSILLNNKISQASIEEIKHLLNDLVLLFFFSAMMGEVTIEAFLSKVKFSKFSYLGFCSSSFITLLLVCLIYAALIFNRSDNALSSNVIQTVNQKVNQFQNFIIFFAFGYCTFIKTILLYEEQNMHNICQSISTI